MAFLFIQQGPNKGAVFHLHQGTAKIGRNPTNDLVVPDDTVSRFHAEIYPRAGHYYIRDLERSQGTFVNDLRIFRETPLENDAVIRLGQTEILFQMEENDQTPSQWKTGESEPVLKDKTPSDMMVLEPGKTIAFSLPSRETATPVLMDKHWEILSRVADATLSVFDLDLLLGTLMDMLFEMFSPDRGVILLYEKDKNELIPKVYRPRQGEVNVSSTIVHYAIENRMSLLIGDTSEDLRFSAAKSIVAQAIRSAICSPLVREDRVLGVIYIDAMSHKITYTKEDLTLLNIVAAHAAISIENTLLIEEKVRAERLAAIGTAVAGISHYVKNILTGLIGSGHLIDMGLQTSDMDLIKSAWPIQKRSAGKISTLVQDMLSYSKEREPDWELGNLNALLTEIYEEQRERAQNASVDLQLELDENLPDSQYDQKGIHDTILNIVTNAIEACTDMPNARVVLRSLQPNPNQLSVLAIDNGPGIPDDIRKKIFEPFFSTKGSKGTGLGLSVARKTVEEHYGTLVLDTTPGQGITFILTLPRKKPDQTQSPLKGSQV